MRPKFYKPLRELLETFSREQQQELYDKLQYEILLKSKTDDMATATRPKPKPKPKPAGEENPPKKPPTP